MRTSRLRAPSSHRGDCRRSGWGILHAASSVPNFSSVVEAKQRQLRVNQRSADAGPDVAFAIADAQQALGRSVGDSVRSAEVRPELRDRLPLGGISRRRRGQPQGGPELWGLGSGLLLGEIEAPLPTLSKGCTCLSPKRHTVTFRLTAAKANPGGQTRQFAIRPLDCSGCACNCANSGRTEVCGNNLPVEGSAAATLQLSQFTGSERAHFKHLRWSRNRCWRPETIS